MIQFLSWYFISLLIGWLAYPIAFRFLPNLSDRGYALSRALGLLLWGFIFWLFASLHILTNDVGGVLIALAALAGLGIWQLRGNWQTLKEFIRQRIGTILTIELLFLVFFGCCAALRAVNPDITGTEKPMELMFINSILRSPAFPPQDGWLSGYAISYYYFGYVLVAMLVRITSVPSGVAFNLAVALWFALTAVSAYGILYTLISRVSSVPKTSADSSLPDHSLQTKLFAILGPLFILLVSNIEGFLEVIHSAGWFWKQDVNGVWQSRFWSWLNILEISDPPTLPFSYVPERLAGIWWWRASRVIQDFDVNGNWREIIDEFPFFSYYLGDLHPHVLAMPFALLAVGLALNLYFTRALPSGQHGIVSWFKAWLNRGNISIFETRLYGWLQRKDFWLAAVVLGGMAFLNTWDFPIYVGLFALAYILARAQDEGWNIQRVGEFLELGIGIGLAGILLYLPFYMGFASQAGGILPGLDFFTRGKYFWVMFASLLLPIFGWLLWLVIQRRPWADLLVGLKIAGFGLLGLLLFSYLFGWLILSLPTLASAVPQGSLLANRLTEWGLLFRNLHGGASSSDILLKSLAWRISAAGTWGALAILATSLWGLISSYRFRLNQSSSPRKAPEVSGEMRSSQTFVLLLVLMGLGLVVFPEFFYLRDQFGWRMNTIFKFYFQTWILWGLAAAYASVVLWKKLRNFGRVLFSVTWLLLICLALMYPYFGIKYKTNDFNPTAWTLDGTYHIQKYNPAEMEAIRWMQKAPLGVVAEAIGGSYSGYGRISTHSGQPTVLGWPGHESQWRGGAEEIGSRESDIERLYRTSNWIEAEEILKKYNIRYIYIGDLERSSYRVNESKFQRYLAPAFQNEGVVVYEFTSSRKDP